MGHRIKWAAKIQPGILKKFYAMCKSGVIDNELVDDVGLRLYKRCEAILMVAQGAFYCPDCANKISVDLNASRNQECGCNNCGFIYTAAEFHESYRRRELLQDDAYTYFGKYYSEYMNCTTNDEKIIMIDTLIHLFYVETKTGAINRAVGNNLIEGSLKQVVALLHELSGIQPESDIIFAKTANLMWRRRRSRAV